MFLHALQLAISINLESVFYLWYIVLLTIRAGNNSVTIMKTCAMPWLPNMQQLKLLTLRWRSFSGLGREDITVDFASKGCQYLIDGYLQPIGTLITQDAKLTMVDAALTLILRMRQAECRGSFSQRRLPLSDKWISANNRKINNTRWKDKNH